MDYRVYISLTQATFAHKMYNPCEILLNVFVAQAVCNRILLRSILCGVRIRKEHKMPVDPKEKFAVEETAEAVDKPTKTNQSLTTNRYQTFTIRNLPIEKQYQIYDLLSCEQLYALRNVARREYEIAIYLIFKRRGPEALQYQYLLMTAWLHTSETVPWFMNGSLQRFPVPDLDKQKWLQLLQASLIDPASDMQHKLICAQMLQRFTHSNPLSNDAPLVVRGNHIHHVAMLINWLKDFNTDYIVDEEDSMHLMSTLLPSSGYYRSTFIDTLLSSLDDADPFNELCLHKIEALNAIVSQQPLSTELIDAYIRMTFKKGSEIDRLSNRPKSLISVFECIARHVSEAEIDNYLQHIFTQYIRHYGRVQTSGLSSNANVMKCLKTLCGRLTSLSEPLLAGIIDIIKSSSSTPKIAAYYILISKYPH